MAVALLTNYLTAYRMPLYARLAREHDVEVLCYGGGERYVPAWITADLEAGLAAAPFPARRLAGGAQEAYAVSGSYDVVIAPYAGGAILPAAYLGARRRGRPFILWASVWSQPWSLTNAAALPLTRHIYRHADAVVAYGEHVRRFVAGIRGRDDDVFVAPQSVEADLFGRDVPAGETDSFRRRHGLGDEPLVLYAGRLVPEKGVEVLLETWTTARPAATLVVVGDGPLAERCREVPGVRPLGVLTREELPVAYAAARFAILASLPTPRFREPWGLVCNEAMHQARPVIATTAVGAAAGGLVRDGETGLVIAPGDPAALGRATDRLLSDPDLIARLGHAARGAVAAFNYDAMAAGFTRALAAAMPSPC
jgi:glycosyltransferase involved in cell wall biosynthesis